MGGHKSKLSEKKVEKIANKTKFSPEEIRQWYQGFMKDCPTGKLQCSEFAKIYQVFYPSGDPKLFSTFVFNLFDRNGDGSIEFDEFLTALSITSRGTAKEKLNWAFQLYDLNGDGSIEKKEMEKIVSAVFAMTGQDATEKEVQVHSDKIFTSMDTDGNGELSKEEFINGALQDKELLSAFAISEHMIEPSH